MKIEDIIRRALDEAIPVRAHNSGAEVSTHYLLPDGSHVTLFASMSQKDNFVLSDNGRTVEVLLANCRTFSKASIKKALELANNAGGVFIDGQFMMRDIDISQLASAIIYLADACHRWATDIILADHRIEQREIYHRIFDELSLLIPKKNIIRDAEITGESNKRYRFDFSVKTDKYKGLIDITTPSPIAIATTFTKIMDVKRQNANYRQTVVAQGKFTSEDINLLQTTADQVLIASRMKPGFAKQLLEISIAHTRH